MNSTRWPPGTMTTALGSPQSSRWRSGAWPASSSAAKVASKSATTTAGWPSTGIVGASVWIRWIWVAAPLEPGEVGAERLGHVDRARSRATASRRRRPRPRRGGPRSRRGAASALRDQSARARRGGCSGRRRRTSAWRAGPRAGRSRRRRSPPRRRAGRRSPRRRPGSTIAAPPLPNTSLPSGSGAGKSSGKADAGMYCGAETTKAPDSIAMWRMLASQPSLSSAVGASQICGPLPGRRRSAPAASGSPSRSARRSGPSGVSRHVEVVAGADAVEEPLVLGRHQLAVARRRRPPGRAAAACCRASRGAPAHAR